MTIFWFCIPAYGHTNPTIELARELAMRGHKIRYYSFEEFREKIESAGAEFVPCDKYLPALDAKAEKRLRKVSTTEMSVNAFETTALMDEMLTKDAAEYKPDFILSDAVCFWGKLLAVKLGLPLICLTTTFAWNQKSSSYLHYSAAETADMVLGLPRMNRAIKKLKPLGYNVKSALDIVQNKPGQDTVVFTSRKFQPFAETFEPEHYCFCGPSVRNVEPKEKTGKPLVYISLGTVINDRPGFYRDCLSALAEEDADVLISCGKAFDAAQLEPLPANAKVLPYVDQMEVLSRASLFITHCGMNSASESLYMGVPMLLYPLTGEQQAVARRVQEMGAGKLLDGGDPASIRQAVRSALANFDMISGVKVMRQDFLSCGGPKEAADFIELRI